MKILYCAPFIICVSTLAMQTQEEPAPIISLRLPKSEFKPGIVYDITGNKEKFVDYLFNFLISDTDSKRKFISRIVDFITLDVSKNQKEIDADPHHYTKIPQLHKLATTHYNMGRSEERNFKEQKAKRAHKLSYALPLFYIGLGYTIHFLWNYYKVNGQKA